MLPPLPTLSASKHMSENNKMKKMKIMSTLYQDAIVDYGHAPETIALML